MASPSKEDNILKLILENSPLKEWHFEEIVKNAKVTKAVANKWLKKYVKEGLLRRIKEKGRFPFFTVGKNNSHYHSLKKIYALQEFHKSGLIGELLSLDVNTVILFGSMIKGDWYKDSDIDVFILGDLRKLDKKLYEKRLNRHIELHIFREKKEIQEVKTGLMKNIINGYVLKGNIHDLVEVS